MPILSNHYINGRTHRSEYGRDVQFNLATNENIPVFVRFCLCVVCTERSKQGFSQVYILIEVVERASTLLRRRLSLTKRSRHGKHSGELARVVKKKFT